MTLDISWIAMILTVAIGIGVAILRISDSIVGRAIAWGYVEVIRNTPILIQILIIYFIIGRIFAIPRFWAGVLCLALYEGAFAAEIIRGGIASVRKGQWEASRSLGLSTFDLYRDIVIPQAIPIMLPPLAGVLVNLVKHSAIVSVIAVFDLATQARTVVSDTFLAFEIWFTAAAMYLSVTISLSLFATWLEQHYEQIYPRLMEETTMTFLTRLFGGLCWRRACCSRRAQPLPRATCSMRSRSAASCRSDMAASCHGRCATNRAIGSASKST